ncbi:MAG TPA: hypothetical protein VNT33_07855 [Telluria sp.]|nr:hypothetical protein [Telluria sp.]
MRTASAILATLLAAPCAAWANAGDGAFELRCESEMRPQFEVRTRHASFKLNTSISGKVLNTRSSYASVNQLLLGMTSGTTRTEILVDGPSLSAGSRECVAPRIVVELSYQPIDVYVAREFNLYSCPYRVVYAHEMKHVAIYREALPTLQQKVEQKLRERFGDRPVYAPAGQGLHKVEDFVDNTLRPYIKAELAKVEQLQRQLDTPEESFNLSHACGGEVANLMGSTF